MKSHGRWVLANGQVWNTSVATIEILRRGKRLIHYRITKRAGRNRVGAQISAIGAMENYLKANDAKLISGGSVA
jgi:hypothetical protein